MPETYIKPKERMIDFIRCISRNTLENSRYVFILEDTTIDDANKYVHNMRVELSRARRQLIQNGYGIKRFKVKTESIIKIENTENIKITLFYKDKHNPELSAAISNLLSKTISTGEKIVDTKNDGAKLNVKIE